MEAKSAKFWEFVKTSYYIFVSSERYARDSARIAYNPTLIRARLQVGISRVRIVLLRRRAADRMVLATTIKFSI